MVHEGDAVYMPVEKLSPVLWRKRRKVKPEMAYYLHWCQGCGHCHTYPTGGISDRANWNFNGNIESPSFTPSMHIFIPAMMLDGEQRPQRTICHYYVTDGNIAYQMDSDHEFRGQTLPLQPIPEDYGF